MKKFLRKPSLIAIAFVIASLFCTSKTFAQGSQTFNTPGTSTFTVPAGVNSITVSAWGGGGAGGGVNGQTKAGGGGEGGSFVRGTIPVTPGAQYTILVGTGGTGVLIATGGAGTASSVTAVSGGTVVFNAIGGAGGAVGNSFGAGGNTLNTGNITSGTATSTFYGGIGGAGSTASTASSGGGGGSAGAGSDGGAGSVATAIAGGTAGTGSGSPADAGFAGTAGRGASSDNNGVDVTNPGNPGAGASGGRNANNTTQYRGGNGGNGQIIIRWSCPAATIAYSRASFCNSLTSAPVAITGSTGGGFTVVPATGLSINASTGEINPSLSSFGAYTVHYKITAGGNGCTTNVDATFAVSIVGGPSTSFTKNDAQCFNTSTGQIVITGSGGTSPYTYSIDNGAHYSTPAPTGTFNGLSAGSYKIRVKDNNGCESKPVL